jgi:hypothetical protein
MPDWRTFNRPRPCGGCGERILPGTWMATLADGRLLRCVDCAERMGYRRPEAAPPTVSEEVHDYGQRINAAIARSDWARVDERSFTEREPAVPADPAPEPSRPDPFDDIPF